MSVTPIPQSDNAGLTFASEQFEISLGVRDGEGASVGLGAGNVLTGPTGGDLGVNAAGFLPGSPGAAYLLSSQSTRSFLARILQVVRSTPLHQWTADDSGVVAASVPIPAQMAPGTYTLQITGYDENGAELAFATSLVVTSGSDPAPTAAIVIKGSRSLSAKAVIIVTGQVTGISGPRLRAWMRRAGESRFTVAKGVVPVDQRGKITWRIKSPQRTVIYLQHRDVKSNRIVL